MALFDDDFAAVDGLFVEVFGDENVIVEDPTGTQWTFAATVGDEAVEQRQGSVGTEIVITREIYLEVDPDGRESDGRPDILNLRGFVLVGYLRYAIERVTHSRSGAAVMHAKRVETGEKAREGYRRRNV